jgi:hypothetical protein
MDNSKDIDQSKLSELLEQSQDVHSDAMKQVREDLAEIVELGHEERSSGVTEEVEQVSGGRRAVLFSGLASASAFAAAGLGAALLGLTSSEAFASQPTDVQILQSNASLEVLAVSTYKTALTLPYIGGSSANPVVKAFAQTTMKQHEEHLAAFNAAAKALGGAAQNNPDPVLVPVVNAAVSKITGPAGVVSLALELENIAAQTYINDTPAFSSVSARKLTASVMGVEAQHVAVLLAVQALLNANAPQLIALPPNVSALPGAAGSVGFPNAFYHTDKARPMTEGAVK